LDPILAFSDEASDALLVVDFGWRIIAVNEHALRFGQWKREAVLGRSYWDVVPVEPGSSLERLLRDACAGHTRVELEAESRLRPGRILRGVAIPVEDGTAILFRDVTVERQEARAREAALQESEARFRHMADSAPAFIWMTDERGSLSFANLHFGYVFGQSTRDMLVNGWERLVESRDLETFKGGFSRALTAREPFRTEVRVRDKNGEVRWIRCDSVPRLDDRGAFLGYTGCGVDITDEKAFEKALLESERRLKAAQEHAGVGIAETDADGAYLQVNEAFCRITEYARDELIGRVCWGLTHENFRTHEEQEYARLVRGELNTYTVEKLFYRKAGDTGWAWLTSTAIRDEAGKFVSAVRTLIDITDDKLADDRKQVLINELNHRVKNTLATVQSIVAQTLRTAADPGQAKTDIESRLTSLSRVHDILTRESWEAADLSDIAAQALSPYRDLEGGRVQSGGPEVRLPPRMALAIAMALQELVTNAVKYGALSCGTGRVTIAWTVDHSCTPPRLQLRWVERGGPRVVPPTRRGFGTRLIERSLAAELGGGASIDFAHTGVRCILGVPLTP